jgi:hypothetical protein
MENTIQCMGDRGQLPLPPTKLPTAKCIYMYLPAVAIAIAYTFYQDQ